MLQGAALEDAVDLGAVDSPDLVRHYVELISYLRQRGAEQPGEKGTVMTRLLIRDGYVLSME